MDLKLSTNDLRWAHWRNIPPEPKPKTQPFDLQASLGKLRKLRRNTKLSVSSLKLNISMSKEEAHFWLEAFCKAGETWRVTNGKLVEHMERPETDFHGNVSVKEIQTLLSTTRSYFMGQGVLLPIFVLLSPTDFVQVIEHFDVGHQFASSALEVFKTQIVVYLTEDEREVYRSALRLKLSNTQLLYTYAALLGGFDAEIEQYLNTRQPKSRQVRYVHTQDFIIVAGLSDPERVQHYIRERQMILHDPTTMKVWVAHTELDGLDWIAFSIKQRHNKSGKKSGFSIFKKLPVIEAVPHVLDLWQDDHLRAEALSWLVKYAELTAQALTPIALSKASNAKLALKYLRRMVSMGQVELLEAQLETLSPEQQAQFKTDVLEFYVSDVPEFTDEDTPEWLSEAIANQGKSKATSVQWVDMLALPPLTIAGKRLNSDQIQHVLIALRGNNDALINGIREHVSQQERDDFAWALYQNWEESGAPSKGKWTFDTLGKLGGDTIVLKLIPLLKKWPGESKHKRASDGIGVLQEIGTDTALMQINSLSQKMRYKSLKRTAQTAMEHIAKARGYSQEELEDRIIPDCGLDEDGKRTFDYGVRQFTFVLSSEMKPMVRDEEKGKIRANLPKPNKKDDEGLSAQAQADWKLIKKQVRDVAKIQADRLEQAMISQRRWKLSDFKELYIKHPLMFHIVRLLVWGGYDETGALVQVFRIDEDRQIVDVDDEPIDIADIATIGVLHVMELDDSERQEWGDVLADYEIIAPFEQLSRKVSTLEADECDKKSITRFAPHKVEPVVLVSILEKSGWIRGQAQDGGMYYSHAKYYSFADVTAMVRYHGVPMGYWDYDKQGIDECFFLKGNHFPEGYKHYKEEQMLPLSEVSPVVLSETMRTLVAISSKAE